MTGTKGEPPQREWDALLFFTATATANLDQYQYDVSHIARTSAYHIPHIYYKNENTLQL